MVLFSLSYWARLPVIILLFLTGGTHYWRYFLLYIYIYISIDRKLKQQLTGAEENEGFTDTHIWHMSISFSSFIWLSCDQMVWELICALTKHFICGTYMWDSLVVKHMTGYDYYLFGSQFHLYHAITCKIDIEVLHVILHSYILFVFLFRDV